MLITTIISILTTPLIKLVNRWTAKKSSSRDSINVFKNLWHPRH